MSNPNVTIIQNASLPLVLYGLHFRPGVAEYTEADKEPYRIFINESAAKKMDATFPGRPIYVDHVDEVNLENLQNEADGYVLESFFNTMDGAHWAKFIIVSERGKAAYRKGWKLSNAYLPTAFGSGGMWHGVQYVKEVMDGQYEHLAIVPNPRYEESVILTPEEFKKYNSDKDIELKKLANSREKQMKFSFFKRTKVENAKDLNLEEMMVELPLSKKQVALVDVIEGFDNVANMNGYACNEHMVKVNEKDEMSVSDLVKKHNDMAAELEEMKKKKNEDGDDMDVMNDEKLEIGAEKGDDVGQKEDKKLFPNAEEEEKKKNGKENFEKLKNARVNASEDNEPAVIMTNSDRVAMGRKLFGSGN